MELTESKKENFLRSLLCPSVFAFGMSLTYPIIGFMLVSKGSGISWVAFFFGFPVAGLCLFALGCVLLHIRKKGLKGKNYYLILDVQYLKVFLFGLFGIFVVCAAFLGYLIFEYKVFQNCNSDPDQVTENSTYCFEHYESVRTVGIFDILMISLSLMLVIEEACTKHSKMKFLVTAKDASKPDALKEVLCRGRSFMVCAVFFIIIGIMAAVIFTREKMVKADLRNVSIVFIFVPAILLAICWVGYISETEESSTFSSITYIALFLTTVALGVNFLFLLLFSNNNFVSCRCMHKTTYSYRIDTINCECPKDKNVLTAVSIVFMVILLFSFVLVFYVKNVLWNILKEEENEKQENRSVSKSKTTKSVHNANKDNENGKREQNKTRKNLETDKNISKTTICRQLEDKETQTKTQNEATRSSHDLNEKQKIPHKKNELLMKKLVQVRREIPLQPVPTSTYNENVRRLQHESSVSPPHECIILHRVDNNQSSPSFKRQSSPRRPLSYVIQSKTRHPSSYVIHSTTQKPYVSYVVHSTTRQAPSSTQQPPSFDSRSSTQQLPLYEELFFSY